MAAPKTRAKYTSKGERVSCDPSILKAVKRQRTESEKLLHKVRAWRKGRNPWIVVNNLDTNNKKEKFVRVRANDAWGHPKKIYVNDNG